MRKNKCRCQYGYYKIPRIKVPDRTFFHLRIAALLLNDDFENYCSHLDKDWEIDPNILSAWRTCGGFPTWAAEHREDYCLIALHFYGNIFHESIGLRWTRFKNAVERVYGGYRPVPLYELSPGTQAPSYSRTVSFDPGLNHNDLLRLFGGFLSVMKKSDIIKPVLSGYFELQPKAKLNQAARFIDAATRAAKIKIDHPKTWLARMTKLYEAYPGNTESKRKTIYSDIKKGQNIAYWALRGLFPKTSNPPR